MPNSLDWRSAHHVCMLSHCPAPCSNHRALFPGNDLSRNVRYTEAYDAVAKAFLKLGIISGKKTHWGRVFGPNRLQAAGYAQLGAPCMGGWPLAGWWVGTVPHCALSLRRPRHQPCTICPLADTPTNAASDWRTRRITGGGRSMVALPTRRCRRLMCTTPPLLC